LEEPFPSRYLGAKFNYKVDLNKLIIKQSNLIVTLATRLEVEQFLAEFHTKHRIFGIALIARTNPRNTETLLRYDISISKLKELIESLSILDYVSGPTEDALYGGSELWVFGNTYRDCELYIKISLGRPNCSVLCISFHAAQFPLIYPYK
jgi:hypothetical protein